MTHTETPAKHTPGPLVVDGFADCQLITKDVPVAQGRPIGIAKVYGPNMIADARLFGAASMLLEGAQDTVVALRLLRIGAATGETSIDAKALEVIDSHIDELTYAINAATGGAA